MKIQWHITDKPHDCSLYVSWLGNLSGNAWLNKHEICPDSLYLKTIPTLYSKMHVLELGDSAKKLKKFNFGQESIKKACFISKQKYTYQLLLL